MSCYIGRYCTSTQFCLPFANTCSSAADCQPSSCCVVIDIDATESNTPGRLLPVARIETCGERPRFCSENRCVTTHPAWWGSSGVGMGGLNDQVLPGGK